MKRLVLALSLFVLVLPQPAEAIPPCRPGDITPWCPPSLPIPLYSSTSFWNTPIGPNPPIDPNSAAMVSYALVGSQGSANFSNTNAWGMPIYLGRSTDPLYHICGSDNGECFDVRIPVGAQPKQSSDAHMIVVNGDVETDMWVAAYDPAQNRWTARFIDQLSVTGWGAMCALGEHCNGAVAAGFGAPGGVVRPDEISRGTINHALVIALPHTRSGIIACPATHTDGKESRLDAIPEGARIQLDPAFVIPTSWAPWQKMMAQALQTYGAYVADTAGSLEIRGEAADLDGRAGTWASVGVPVGPSLSFLPWSQMRVLQITPC